VRAILAAFRGEEPLTFEGEFYTFTLLTPQWTPGPIAHDRIPIDVAGVNPWMLRMAGEVADGLHVHPLNNPTYLRETVLPNLAQGAARAGRDRSDLTVFAPCFTAAGETDEEVAAGREQLRRQLSFYGSTPNYAFLFEQVGFPGTTERIRERQKAGDLDGMAAVIDDDLLDVFAVSGTWSEVPGRLVERFSGLADRVVLYLAGTDLTTQPAQLERWGAVAAEVVRAGGA
jgi:probable F420-dependent oxidoreductase